MTLLLPVDQNLTAELDAKLAGTMFRSIEDFIQFYNSGMVNKNDETVANFAAEVDANLKNVKLQGKTLVFISQAEVELEESLHGLRAWAFVIKVKDTLAELLSAGALNGNETLSFDNGALVKNEVDSSGEPVVSKVSEEKLYKPAEEELFFSAMEEKAGVGHTFSSSDFTSIDESFISQIHSILFS